MSPDPTEGVRRRARRPLIAIALTGAMSLALIPPPAGAQLPDVPGLPEVPGLPDPGEGLPSIADLIDELGEIVGLDPLDPILGPVTDLIRGLEETLGQDEGTSPNTVQLHGDDAVEAAIAFSEVAFPDGAGTAVLGRDDLFADGMSSSGFQGVFDAPLLLTGSEDLDQRTGLELQRLSIDDLTILGGEDALNPLVVSKLEIAGLDVTRVGGETRVETSVEAAEATAPTATHAMLVRAYPDEDEPDNQAYADLLAAGPFAAENGWPVLMTLSSELHPEVQAQLEGFEAVTIIGGANAIEEVVEEALTDLGLTVDRVSGDNRFATAIAIANERGFESSADPDQIVLAEQGGRDDVWAPGFASSAYADRNDAPVLLSDGDTLPDETLEFLAAGVEENLEDGGPAIICAPFVSDEACEGAGRIVIGDVSGGGDILGIDPADLPLIGDILDALAEAGLLPDELQELIDTLIGGGLSPDDLDDLIDGIVSGDPEAVVDALEDIVGLLPGPPGGGGGDDGGDDGDDGGGDDEDEGNPVTELIEDLIGGGVPGAPGLGG